jgi:3'(2'), 5'-bisphosphate nucleotidase
MRRERVRCVEMTLRTAAAAGPMHAGRVREAPARDHAACASFASAAGELLLALREELLSRRAEASVLRDEGDLRSHTFLAGALSDMYPDDGFLSEEGARDSSRLAARRVWIVDPLDGTREFSEERSDWAVHVALAVDGVAAAGAVSTPARGLTLATRPRPRVAPAAAGRARIAVSRTRPPEIASQLAERLGAELVPMGSAGAKAMAVVLGEAELYVHAGGQYEWDSAAPVAVAEAAGLHVSRLDGSPLRYNQPDPWLPDLLVCRRSLAPAVLGAIAQL